MIVFEEEYSSESLYDLGRDVHEAFDERFNPIMNKIPKDECNFHTGTFKVTIEWIEE